MAKFDDFEQVYEPLALPIGGKTYTIPPVSAAEGLKFTAAVTQQDGAEFFSDEQLRVMLLGDVHTQMVADGVPEAAIRRAELAALADFQTGRESAAVMWATGGDPKALEAYVRKNAPNRASRRSKSTATARKIP